MTFRSTVLAVAILAFAGAVVTTAASASSNQTTRKTSTGTTAKKSSSGAKVSSASSRKASRAKRKRRAVRRKPRQRWFTSPYADDVTEGDITDGEDPVVRAAAEEALGNLNGTVVAIDPNSGRILAMVNQKLALAEGAQPCSTFKVAVALAALSEGVITKETELRLGRRTRLTLTEAMARSNNAYFEVLGRRLGFDKVAHYAQQFGMGELAGLNIEGERLGIFPSKALAANLGGVGRMCSFGESIFMTPLQLGAMLAAVANGGTLYWLQHPQSPEELDEFRPVVKRRLGNMEAFLPDVTEGLSAAVERGTARNVGLHFSDEPVLGKTGTCSKGGTRFGWFASYADTSYGKIVVVVFLRGGATTVGPRAAKVSGKIYRALYDNDYFAAKPPSVPESKAESVGVAQ